MIGKHDKRHTATVFRERLAQAMAWRGLSQSALARQAGTDRSTISQLLAAGATRLPNAHLVARCAAVLGVSADWLLGLSARPESAAELLAVSLSVTEAPRAPVDEQIFAWHQEAAGYKIRHVPAALPDMLKTREMLEWEYAPHLGRTTEQAIGASEDRLAFMRELRSDYEIALPMHEMESFARGQGYYAGLPQAVRDAQIARLIALHEQLYPALRLFFYDARRVFSAPVTIFGPLLAVVYLGHHYMAFRDSERVQLFTRHFDALVREAAVADREVPGWLERLRAAPPA